MPSLKNPSSTTTTSTTTTEAPTTTPTSLPPCGGPDSNGLCGGDCPPGMKCLATSSVDCGCVPMSAGCAGDAAACAGLCPNVNQLCQFVAPPGQCLCFVPKEVRRRDARHVTSGAVDGTDRGAEE